MVERTFLLTNISALAPIVHLPLRWPIRTECLLNGPFDRRRLISYVFDVPSKPFKVGHLGDNFSILKPTGKCHFELTRELSGNKNLSCLASNAIEEPYGVSGTFLGGKSFQRVVIKRTRWQTLRVSSTSSRERQESITNTAPDRHICHLATARPYHDHR